MDDTYRSPWAKVARILEIIIPAYMFGKSWGIADEKTVDLFRAEFPRAVIDGAEFLKGLVGASHEYLGRFVATNAGAIVGIAIVLLLAVVFHFALGDRKYIDSLRFTSVSLIPLAILNGTLSHLMKTLLENFDTTTATPEALKQAAMISPNNFFYLYVFFYLTAIWFLGRRTGVTGKRRYVITAVGVCVIVLYRAAGLMITAAEWQVLEPKLLKIFVH